MRTVLQLMEQTVMVRPFEDALADLLDEYADEDIVDVIDVLEVATMALRSNPSYWDNAA